MQSGEIPDSSLTASSSSDPITYGPQNSRYENTAVIRRNVSYVHYSFFHIYMVMSVTLGLRYGYMCGACELHTHTHKGAHEQSSFIQTRCRGLGDWSLVSRRTPPPSRTHPLSYCRMLMLLKPAWPWYIVAYCLLPWRCVANHRMFYPRFTVYISKLSKIQRDDKMQLAISWQSSVKLIDWWMCCHGDRLIKLCRPCLPPKYLFVLSINWLPAAVGDTPIHCMRPCYNLNLFSLNSLEKSISN